MQACDSCAYIFLGLVQLRALTLIFTLAIDAVNIIV